MADEALAASFEELATSISDISRQVAHTAGIAGRVAGDFNANASSGVDPSFATYQLLLGAGLVDVWPQKGGADPASPAART